MIVLAGIKIFLACMNYHLLFGQAHRRKQTNKKYTNWTYSYGYFFFHSLLESQSSTLSNYILEKYIYPPLLLDRRKFSLGIYCVITSVDPLVIWFCEDEILILLAIEPFDLSKNENVEERNASDKRLVSDLKML